MSDVSFMDAMSESFVCVVKPSRLKSVAGRWNDIVLYGPNLLSSFSYA